MKKSTKQTNPKNSYNNNLTSSLTISDNLHFQEEIFPTFMPIKIAFHNDTIIAAYDYISQNTLINFTELLHSIGFSEIKTTRLLQKLKSDNVIRKYLKYFSTSLSSSTFHDVYIDNKKLSIALAKISITPKMRKGEKTLVQKLELYQDILSETIENMNIKEISKNSYCQNALKKSFKDALYCENNNIFFETKSILNTFLDTIQSTKLEKINQKQKSKSSSKTSEWVSKMFPKYNMLINYFHLDNYKQLYSQLYKQFQNTYPGIDFDYIIKDYCSRNNVKSCYIQEAIEESPEIRQLFENMVDSLLEKYNLCERLVLKHQSTIFDN